MVGEAGLDLRVAERHERTGPEPRRRGVRRSAPAIFSAFICRRSPLIFTNSGTRSADDACSSELGRMRQNLGHDALGGIGRRSRCGCVGTASRTPCRRRTPWLRCPLRRARRRRSARSDPGRAAARRTPPSSTRSAPVTPAPLAGKPAYSTSPTRTPEVTSGGVARYTHHLGAAVVDVVMRRQHGDPRRLEPDLHVAAVACSTASAATETTCGSP